VQSNLIKNIEKILTAFGNMGKLPKALIKYGCYVFFGLLTIGTILVLLNHTLLPYNSHFDMVSKAIVLTSFTLVAEAIIGGLVMDFVFNKK
jgi:hypothetical protein